MATQWFYWWPRLACWCSYHESCKLPWPCYSFIYITSVALYIILWLLNGFTGGPDWPADALIMKAVRYHDPVIVLYTFSSTLYNFVATQWFYWWPRLACWCSYHRSCKLPWPCYSFIYIISEALYIILWQLNGFTCGPDWPADALIMKAVSYHDPVIVLYTTLQ